MLFAFVKRFLNGDFATTREVRKLLTINNEIRALSIDEARARCAILLPESEAFNLFDARPVPSEIHLPASLGAFVKEYGHIICVHNEIEIDASAIYACDKNPTHLVLGRSRDGVYLIADAQTGVVWEAEDVRGEPLPVDTLPSIFHWVIYQYRLSQLS